MYINTQIITQKKYKKVLKIHDVKVLPGYFSHTNIDQTKIQQIEIYVQKRKKLQKLNTKVMTRYFWSIWEALASRPENGCPQNLWLRCTLCSLKEVRKREAGRGSTFETIQHYLGTEYF